MRDDLAGTSFGDPDSEAARDKTLTDLANCEGYALLGGFVDHLLAHASSDGTELVLLEKAADVWADGVALYGVLGSVRTELEAAIEAPGDPTAAGRFNAAAMEAQRLAQRLHGLQAQIVLLREEIDPLLHLPAHPRQVDKPANSWDWGNFLLARRTDAFVRALAGRGRAIRAVPGRSHWAGVGELHRQREQADTRISGMSSEDRVEVTATATGSAPRNTIGSWLRRHHPTIPSLTAMADRVGFGDPAVAQLPQTLEALILEHAVSGTFDASRTPSLPDLSLGYRRLVTHLELLDRFVMPPTPAMPSPHFTAVLFADPANRAGKHRHRLRKSAAWAWARTPRAAERSARTTARRGKRGRALRRGHRVDHPVRDLVGRDALIKCIVEWADGKKCNYFEELGDTDQGLVRGGSAAPERPAHHRGSGYDRPGADGVRRHRAGRAARRPPVGPPAADVGGARPGLRLPAPRPG